MFRSVGTLGCEVLRVGFGVSSNSCGWPVRPILGVGELLWDVYPDGRKVAGGSPFNFAYHCHALGHPAQVVTAVGDDDLGRELRGVVRDLGMSDALIQTVPYPTGTVRVTLDAAGVPRYAITENVAWDHLAWTPELAALVNYLYPTLPKART